jgi:Leucine-rich repeat (LRR) protein
MRQSGNPRRKLVDLSPYVPYAAIRDGVDGVVAAARAEASSGASVVTGINLSGAGLSAVRVPSSWWGLTELFLQKNSLRALPAALGKLRLLRTLDVSYNSLVTLPRELGQLLELRELNVSCNRLTELDPEIFGRLFRLEACQHEGNPLVAPPQHVLADGAYALFRHCCDSMAAVAPPERVLRHVMPEREQAHLQAQGAVKARGGY